MVALLYYENTDSSTTPSVRFFNSVENARAEMRDSFDKSNAILCFPPSDPADPEYDEAEDHYTSISDNNICVRDEMDSYDWEIIEVVPEDEA